MLLNYDTWNWLNFSQNEKKKNDILTTFGSLQKAHNIKSPRDLCNDFTSGIKPSEFCTVLVCREYSFLCSLVSWSFYNTLSVKTIQSFIFTNK